MLSMAACTTDSQSSVESNTFEVEPKILSKADTGYINPDGVEIEVDIEADVQSTGFGLRNAPALLGQFAMTYLREREIMYLESLAEDSTSSRRVEWLVNGAWVDAAAAAMLPESQLTHFRIRAVNAVLLEGGASSAEVGRVLQAEIPMNPRGLMSLAGNTCVNPDNHLGLSDSIYWYMWNPDRPACVVPTQQMSLTVRKVTPRAPIVYPEYDRLLADQKITAVVLFGQIDDEAGPNETGARNFKKMATSLARGGFREVPGPVGKRFTKQIGVNEMQIDLYAPTDFSGLGDYAHFANFQRAISEHEIVAYDGHSMLGASDFWSRPTYPDNYQIFLYGGCLGYEYYVRPILGGKQGWENVDILSSVIEVTADANMFAAPILSKLAFGLKNNTLPSWNDLTTLVRQSVGDSTFGVSGVRDNCYSPTGSLCSTDVDPVEPTATTFTNETALPLPDLQTARSTIAVPTAGTIGAVELGLDLTHTYPGDLVLTLKHGGVSAVLSENAESLPTTLRTDAFAGQSGAGEWVLEITDTARVDTGTLRSWTLRLAQ